MMITTYPTGLVTYRHTAGHVLTLPADTGPQELAEKIGAFVHTIESCDNTDAGMHSLHRQVGALRGQLDTARTNLKAARQELTKISGGFEARIEARRVVDQQLAEAKREAESWRGRAMSYRKARNELLDQLETEGRTLRIDGDLLADTIIEACPEWLTDDACRDIAERAISELARIPPPGVTVLRGTNSDPWTPDPEPAAANSPDTGNDLKCNTVECDENGVVDASIIGDEWFEWAVFRADTVSEHPFHVADAHDQADAERLADEIDGAWVARRRVITEDWVAVG